MTKSADKSADKSAGKQAQQLDNLPANTAAMGSGMDAGRLINKDTRGVLVLFPYVPKAGATSEGKTLPVMTGSIDTRDAKIPVAAFAKQTDEGREYLSLSIGFADHEHISGVMFRQEKQNPADGIWEVAPGKGNERFGLISKQTKNADETFTKVFELRFFGGRKLSRLNMPYIRAQIYPQQLGTVEGQGDEVMDGCF